MRTRRIHLIGAASTATALAAAIAAALWMVPRPQLGRSATDEIVIIGSHDTDACTASDADAFDATPFMRSRWAPPREREAGREAANEALATGARAPFVLLAITTDADGTARAVLLDERDGLIHRSLAGAMIGDWVVESIRSSGVLVRRDGRIMQLALDGSVTVAAEDSP